MDEANPGRTRRLIEEWLPIAEIGIEAVREGGAAIKPAPNRLHVWWARRPLVASRAAILASLLPADADRIRFLHALGIHGDPMKAKERIADANRRGVLLGKDAYGYKRAFWFTLGVEEQNWLKEARRGGNSRDTTTVLDPTAGGGSIPFEATRLGLRTIANDVNPVAWLILRATVEFPAKYGSPLLKRYQELGAEFKRRAVLRLAEYYPPEPLPNSVPDAYLWARTITCPYCGGLVPLSPNWRLNIKGAGVRLVPHINDQACQHCTIEIVHKTKDHSPGTVKQGDGLCPYPDCGRVIDGDEVKKQARDGDMGEQLYAVVFKQTIKVGVTKTGKPKYKSIRGYRAPQTSDDVSEQVKAALDAKRAEWEARNIYPTERFLDCYRRNMRDCIDKYGFNYWTEFFSLRQLLGHCTSVEVFHELVEEVSGQCGGVIPDIDKAAFSFLAIALDKLLNYNSRKSVWMTTREMVANTFNRHDFSFCWSHSEMAPTIEGLGYDWTVEQTGKALAELIELTASSNDDDPLFPPHSSKGSIDVSLGSGASLSLPDASVDCVVMDPPYYDNVTYSELSDFFYVWLKRTIGLLFPDEFSSYLTEKDQEAIANPFRFRDQENAKKLAGRDYQERMAEIFRECRRVVKTDGVMTVMFTHKASGAWDALATGLVSSGWTITASWPVNTESDASMHIREKSAAKSTIFLVCRPRETQAEDAEPVYWEDVEPRVAETVRRRIGEFQAAGIGGIDLYLASFGPALQVFSESWPLTRGRPVTRTNGKKTKAVRPGDDDPYAVRPEDALDAARREVKRWRLDQLATIKRRHHLDPLTEWYILAWDAFKAPRFPVDEALKLARVAGLDFDREVKNEVCEAKSKEGDVTLWDSLTRKKKGRLGPVGGPAVIDTLHQAAALVREQNTGAAQAALAQAGLLNDASLMTALETLLNVLPPPALAGKKKADGGLSGAASDFEALEKLRRLAFADSVPAPQVQLELSFVGETQQTLGLADDEEADE
jgi:putative DNA methylase